MKNKQKKQSEYGQLGSASSSSPLLPNLHYLKSFNQNTFQSLQHRMNFVFD
jgi:hypothetical protein